MKIRIKEITGWREDQALIAGDASRNGDRAVQRILESERVQKIDKGGSEESYLPFDVEADSIDEALDKYNELFHKYDYLKADEAEHEIVLVPQEHWGEQPQ